MRKTMAWFAVPAAVALGATWVSAPASAAISPPQIVNVDGGGSDTARAIAVDTAGNAYLGVGVADAVRSAHEAAERVRAHLAGEPVRSENVR